MDNYSISNSFVEYSSIRLKSETIADIANYINSDSAIINLKLKLKKEENILLSIGSIDENILCMTLDAEKKHSLYTIKYDTDTPDNIISLILTKYYNT